MEIEILLLLFFFGCLGGLLSGILGLGAGLVFIVIFNTYFTSQHIPNEIIAQLILANSMFVVFFSGISGCIKQHFNANFFIKPVLFIGLSSIICSVTTTYLINHTHWYNKRVFTVIFIFVTAYIAFKFLFLKDENNRDLPPNRSNPIVLLLIGVIGGIMLALAGVGSGVTMILLMIKLLDIDVKKATSISLGVVTITALFTAISAFCMHPKTPLNHPHVIGLIFLPMVLPTALGCLLFSPLGVDISKKLSNKTIRIMFVIFLAVAIGNMIHSF